MTALPKVTDLTDAQLNILVSEECGWFGIQKSGRLDGQVVGYPPRAPIVGKKVVVPNYTESLDAMHKAEKHLGYKCGKYFVAIQKLIPRSYDNNPTIENFFIHATAKQRAQAFVVAKSRAVL